MSKLLFDGVFGFLETFLKSIGNSSKNLDILFYVFVGMELLFVIYFLIKSHFAYQFRLLRSIDKINIYLLNNSYINENNLIEFNKKMKKVPKTFRYHWQQYMLYREQSPSFYMSSINVIDKPLRSSSVKNNIRTMRSLTIMFATLSMLFSAAVLAFSTTQASYISTNIFRISLIPCLVIFVGSLYSIYQNARQTANLSDLYQTFHIFQRLVDKAVTTMPEYVDFEVLFTKKEIAKGIPALNAYLEKRARQEQEELEKARRNAIDHEVYDFGSVDISGSLILDRAMKETEIYLSLRNRLLAEIQQVESQIDTLKKSYDNAQREIQRKMQTAKENIERIRMQQESSTNRIEGNYLKKQQDQEISKLTQLEKDNSEETYRFNQELEALTGEIDKKKTELEERRKYIEVSMIAEYKTYSTKVFKNLLKVASEKEKVERDNLNETKDNYAQQIVELREQIKELTYENSQLKDKIRNFDGELYAKDANELNKAAENSKSDSDMNEDFVEGLENFEPAVLQENIDEQQIEEQEQQNAAQNLVSDFESEEPQVSAPDIDQAQASEEEQPPVDEYEGYYDSEGYYRYPNGTYYDPQGRYFDETGGYFDIDGNYHGPDETKALIEEIERQKQAAIEQDELPEAENQTDDVVEQDDAQNALDSADQQQIESEGVEQNPIEQGGEVALVEQSITEDESILSDEVEKDQKDLTQPTTEQFDNIEEFDSADFGNFDEFDDSDFESFEKFDDVNLDVEDAEESQQPKKKAGRPKKETTTKRGPGRPKKTEAKRGPGRPAGSQKASTTKVGRPKKTEAKRGPGRPKKTEAKRGPGRPPKKKGPGRPAGSTKASTAKVGRPKKTEAKRGPGRPKKKKVGRPKKTN